MSLELTQEEEQRIGDLDRHVGMIQELGGRQKTQGRFRSTMGR